MNEYRILSNSTYMKTKYFLYFFLLLYSFTNNSHGEISDTTSIYFTWNIQGEIGISQNDKKNEINLFSALGSLTKDSNHFLIDMGNSYFPGYLSRFSYGSIVNEILNVIKCDAKVITAQDLSFGKETILKLMQHSSFDFFSTNLTNCNDNSSLFPNYFEISTDNSKISFFSIILNGNDWETRNWKNECIVLKDPAIALSKIPITKDQSIFNICFLSKEVLTKYPSLTDHSSINLFIVGLPQFNPFETKTKEEILLNGKRILYVPSFQNGIGKLWKVRDSNNNHSDWNYTIIDLHNIRPDSLTNTRLQMLIAKWHKIYNEESGGTIATMDSSLHNNQNEILGNLLREWGKTELACIENTLASGNNLPKEIKVSDLDRFISSSPDLLFAKIKGDDLFRMFQEKQISWVGVYENKISGRNIERQKFYSVILTENSYTVLKIRNKQSLKKVKYLHESLFDVLAFQLRKRQNKSYDFVNLEKKIHLWNENMMEMSFRRVDVVNRDSIQKLSGLSYKPYTAWNINTKLPVMLYNNKQKIEIIPRLEYAAIDDIIGKNNLDLKIDYGYGASPILSPYASASYVSFITNPKHESKAVRFQTSAGLRSSPPNWRIKIGVGAEKLGYSTKSSPINSFNDLLSDNKKWGPGAELSFEGSYPLNPILTKLPMSIVPEQDLRLNILYEAYLGGGSQAKRMENKAALDLIATPNSAVKLKLSYKIYHAFLYQEKRGILNAEPSVSILGTYQITR